MNIRSARILALVCALAVWPVWRYLVHFGLQGGNSAITGWVLLVLTAVWFVREQRRIPGTPSADPVFIGLSAGFLILYTVSFPFLPALAQAILAMIAWGAALASCFPRKTFSRLPLVVLPVLSLPLEPTLQFVLGYPLRRITALSTAVLLFPLRAQVRGTMLLAGGKMLEVDAPCSGARGLWLFLILGNLYPLIRRKSHRLWFFSLAASLLSALFYNIARSSVLFLAYYILPELPDRLHNALGASAFAFSLGFFALLLFLGEKFLRLSISQESGI